MSFSIQAVFKENHQSNQVKSYTNNQKKQNE